MKSDLLEYKGYFGSVGYSHDDDCLVGKIEFIDDLVLYDASTVPELQQAFREAVDDYVVRCREAGHEPNVTWKGSLNVRLGPDLHKQCALLARKRNQTLNEFLKEAAHAAVSSNAEKPPLVDYFHTHLFGTRHHDPFPSNVSLVMGDPNFGQKIISELQTQLSKVVSTSTDVRLNEPRQHGRWVGVLQSRALEPLTHSSNKCELTKH